MYIVIIYLIIAIFITFFIVLSLLVNQKYRMKSNSLVKRRAENLYSKDFPDKKIEDLEKEIEIIADKLIDYQQTNRYTENLREKAKKDYKIKILKKLCLDDAKIVNYRNKKMKAKVKFKDYDEEYYMLMNLNIVNKGRIFLNSYKILKSRIKIKEETF